MRKLILLLTVGCVLFASMVAHGQEPPKPLTNADIVEMTKAGLPETTIILAIQKGPTQFDTSALTLIQLKNAGTSPKVMDAMIQAGTPPPAAGATGRARIAGEPDPNNPFGVPTAGASASVGSSTVIFVDLERRNAMKYSTPDTRSNSMLGAVVNPFHKSRIKAALRGAHSELRTTNISPTFEVTLPRDAKASDLVAVVKFKTKADSREIETSSAGITGISFGFKKEDLVAVSLEEIEGAGSASYSVYRVKLVNPLPPGEYALVMQSGIYYDFGVDGH